MSRIRWAAVIVSVLGLLGTVLGTLCSRPEGTDQEHQHRVEAETALHRAETELEIPIVTEEARAEVVTIAWQANRTVRKTIPPRGDHATPDTALADALNAALGIAVR